MAPFTSRPARIVRPGTLPVALLVSLIASSVLAQAHFAPSVNYGAGLTPVSIASGDLNGDGFIDLVTANPADPTGTGADLTVLLGNGDGTFGSAASVLAGTQPIFVALGHFDAGPTLDLAVVSAGGPPDGVSILLGVGDGTFGPPSQVATAPDLRRLAIGDFNADGQKDIAATNYDGHRILILLGDGTGGFSSAPDVILAFGSSPYAIAAGNFNADPYEDLVVGNSGAASVSVLVSDGSGGFSLAAGSPVAVGNAPQFVAPADFNTDGFLDLAVTSLSTGNVYVLLGNGAGGLSGAAGSPVFLGSLPGAIAVADYDGDTKTDLAIAQLGSGTVSILRGDALGGFVVEGSFGVGAEAMVAADFNGDSKPDLASANYGGNAASALLNITENTTTTLSSSPNPSILGAPVTFTATVTGPSPSGTMTFKADGSEILDCGVSGVVTFTGSTVDCTTTSLGPGSHVITAEFVGNAPYNNSSATLPGGQDVVTLVSTTTAVTTSGSPSFPSALVTFTATVTGSGPTGTVDFQDGGSSIAGCDPAPLVAGVATCATTSLGPGPHAITADYSGDGVNDASTGTLPGGQNVVTMTGFGNAGTYALPGGATLVAGDFDTFGAGNVGLALTQPGLDQISTLYGNGDGTFGAMSPIAVSSGPTALAVADFDGNSASDLAVGNFTSNDVLLLPSDGLFAFGAPVGPYAGGNGPVAAVAKDFDGSGFPDLAVANRLDNSITIFKSDDSGGLLSGATYGGAEGVGNEPVAIAAGNLNGDPFTDLAVLNQADGTVSVLFLNSDLLPIGFSTFPTGSQPTAIVVSDMNADGFTDLVVTNKGDDTVTILLGDGLGGFTAAGSFPVGDGPESVTVANLNGDSFPDLAIANDFSHDVSVLYGDGTGSFTAPVNLGLNPGSHPISIVAADFNGDGKTDLAVATVVDGVTIFLNSISPPAPPHSLVADPGDGEAKITFTPAISSDGEPPVLFYEATCQPGDVTATTVLPPAAITVTGLTNGDTYTCSIRAHSLVGPGPASATVVVTPQFLSSVIMFSSSNPSTLGAPVTLFALVSGPTATGTVDFLQDGIPIPSCAGVAVISGFAFCSIDDLELGANVITAEYSGDAANTAATGTLAPDQVVLSAAPKFGGPAAFPINGPYSVTVANLNGDASPDLIVTRPGANELSYFNGQSGAFVSPVVAAGTATVGAHPLAVAVGDFDTDGLQDHAAVNRDDGTVSVIFGSGLPAPLLFVGGHPTGIATGDFDADGSLDLAVTNSDDDNVSILLGDGTGNFTPAGSSPLAAGDAPSALALGDLNGDTFLDLAVTNQGEDTVSVIFGAGDGTFGPATPFGLGAGPTAVALADVDHDLDLDIVVTDGIGGTVSVLLNDGFGDFSTGASFVGGATPNSLAIADFNADGHPDIVIANIGCEDISLLFGDGLGNFSAPFNLDTGIGSSPSSVVVTDFNGDGLPDIAVTASGTNELLIFLNSLPTVLSLSVANITDTTADLSAYVTTDGGSVVSDRGFLLSETAVDSYPEIGDGSAVLNDGAGLGPISTSLTGLLPSTQYSVRAYATNAFGTIYTTVATFTTQGLPTVTNLAVTNVTTSTADASAEVTVDGGSPVTNRGFLWAETAIDSDPEVGEAGVVQQDVGTGLGPIATGLSGLAPSTQYSVRAFATNGTGTGYSTVGTFMTFATCPAITLGDLFNGTLNQPFTGSVAASGGNAPYTYSLTLGSLHPSLNLNLSGLGAGQITGTPGITGTFNFNVTATDADSCTGTRSYTLHVGSDVAPGDLVIREFRWRGPAGPEDEFVKVFNRSAGEVTIAATDGSPGFAILAARTASSALPEVLVVIPNGTKIKQGGFFLAANDTPTTGFSLKDYGGADATLPDATWSTDVFDNSGVGLFRSAVTMDVPSRLDGVGFSGSLTEFREGTGLVLPSGSTTGGQFSFLRKAPYPLGIVQDTGSNSADFVFASTDAGIYDTVQSALGTPGPQNGTSMASRFLPSERIDLTVLTNLPPNLVQVGNNQYVRKRVTNNTGAPIKKLRLRVVALTTLFGVGYSPGVQADMRGITTPDAPITLPGPVLVTARGLTLEAPTVAFSATGKGAGYNASFTVDLSDFGPTGWPDGETIYVNLGFRGVRGGTSHFLLVPEIQE